MNVVAENPKWVNRDRFILSAGHGAPLLYSALHLAGFGITMEDMKAVSKIFNDLMGTSVAPRKKFIEENSWRANVDV